MVDQENERRYDGAIDQGTTSTRFMVFDHSGRELGRHQLEHEQILPAAGWVEHDAAQIWARTQTVVGAGLRAAIEVARDGTIYATQTGGDDPTSWKVFKVTARGESSVFYTGAPLSRPKPAAAALPRRPRAARRRDCRGR